MIESSSGFALACKFSRCTDASNPQLDMRFADLSFIQYSICLSIIGITSPFTLGNISPNSKYVGRITNLRKPI